METEVPDFRSSVRFVTAWVVFDCPKSASSSTVIKLRHCGAPRGTLGELRDLFVSGKQDLFDLIP